MKKIDRIDRNILRELQINGRISNVDLSKKVDLSPTPCLERVRRLERQGYIQGYTALLNTDLLNANLLVFIEITLDKSIPGIIDRFGSEVIELPMIQDCHLVSGNFDYLLKARVADMASYRTLLAGTLLLLSGIKNSRSYVVIDEIKSCTHLLIE